MEFSEDTRPLHLPNPGLVRLVNGVDGSTSLGFVEAVVNGQWGAVCGWSYNGIWGNTQARVVCRQLGLPSSNAIGFTDSQYPQYVDLPGPGTNGTLPIVMSWVQCNGTEASLQDCPYFTGLPTGNGYTYACQDAGEGTQRDHPWLELCRSLILGACHTHRCHLSQLLGAPAP